MKTTKEQQFGRVRTFNLPELLSVICDDSKIFQKKLIDIGHNRDTAQKQSKSKYLGKKSNISKKSRNALQNSITQRCNIQFVESSYTKS